MEKGGGERAGGRGLGWEFEWGMSQTFFFLCCPGHIPNVSQEPLCSQFFVQPR